MSSSNTAAANANKEASSSKTSPSSPSPSLTTTTVNEAIERNEYGDLDTHNVHVWFLEPKIDYGDADRSYGCVLTVDGLNQIKHHKYKAGSYTSLDTFLSPNLWEPLVKLCPMWLAPNLITTIGGCFGLLSLCVSQYYIDQWKLNPTTIEEPPNWLYVLNAFCMFTYYTFDCMDGKQARRTNSSSPLGQLFDHGMDCLTILSIVRMAHSITLVEDEWITFIQITLQFSFWQAQWEEYHTGILPHAQGDFGVTETNYGFALWSMMTAIFGRSGYDKVVYYYDSPPDGIKLQVKHIVGIVWGCVVLSLMIQSIIRVYKHYHNSQNSSSSSDNNNNSTTKSFIWSMSQFISPTLLCLLSSTESRNAMGLCYCLITIKIIVYSMARQAYASIQSDIIPYCIMMILIKYYYYHGDGDDNDNDTSRYYLYYIVDLYYFLRLIYWIHGAITQLCHHLDIPLFRIKPKKK